MTSLNPLSVQADPGNSPYDAGRLRILDDGYGNVGSFTTNVIVGKESDWFKVALDSNNLYQFNVTGFGGTPDMTIRGPFGQRMEPFYKSLDGKDMTLRFQPPTRGQYFLDVEASYNKKSTGGGLPSFDFFGSNKPKRGNGNEMRYNLSVEGQLLTQRSTPSQEIPEPKATPNVDTSTKYVLVDGPTWSEAQAEAEALGGNLVSINSKTEQDLLEKQFSSTLATQPLWIGYRDTDSTGSFDWTDNSNSTYTNWAGGEPNALTEKFVFMYPNGTWNDSEEYREFMFKGIAEIPVATDPGSTPAPVDSSNDRGTNITINGDVYGDVIIGDGNTINKGVTVIDGRRWDTLRGDDGDNVIGYEEGLDRMRMKGGDGVDTFVLGDYTDNKRVSTWVRDFNDDFIGFDLTSLGLDDAVVGQADNRREFRELRSGDENIIMYNNKVYSDLNGESKGLGGGELFAKIQGDDVSLSDIAVMDV